MILEASSQNIKTVAGYLKHGDIVAVPSETVYGLAGSVKIPESILKIFEMKQRPSFDPLITHIPTAWANLETLSQEKIIDIGEITRLQIENLVNQIINKMWPGPLTIVLPKHPEFSDVITSGLSSVAVRCPSHPVFQNLLSTFGGALAAPSANGFGRISPTSAKDVEKELPKLKAIVDGGDATIGIESTVIRPIGPSEIQILRAGKFTDDDFQKIIPSLQIATPSADDKRASPGTMKSHYAPRTPLWTFTDINKVPNLNSFKSVGVLFWSNQTTQTLPEHTQISKFVLSPKGDANEAAFQLFKTLRKLDESGMELILAQLVSEPKGIAIAICDRLRRAGSQSC